jgi:hypothetical protein
LLYPSSPSTVLPAFLARINHASTVCEEKAHSLFYFVLRIHYFYTGPETGTNTLRNLSERNMFVKAVVYKYSGENPFFKFCNKFISMLFGALLDHSSERLSAKRTIE